MWNAAAQAQGKLQDPDQRSNSERYPTITLNALALNVLALNALKVPSLNELAAVLGPLMVGLGLLLLFLALLAYWTSSVYWASYDKKEQEKKWHEPSS